MGGLDVRPGGTLTGGSGGLASATLTGGSGGSASATPMDDCSGGSANETLAIDSGRRASGWAPVRQTVDSEP